MDLKKPTQPANRKRKTKTKQQSMRGCDATRASKRRYSRSTSIDDLPHERMTYRPMDMVEVRLDGGQGHRYSSWTPAQFAFNLRGKINHFYTWHGASTINNCLVQYWRKQNDGWSGVYVADNQIRPCPPQHEEIEFKWLDMVDAFVDNSWWVGTITDVRADNYMVTLKLTNEQKECNHSQLRRHCEWIDGKWELHVSVEADSSKVEDKGVKSEADIADLKVVPPWMVKEEMNLTMKVVPPCKLSQMHISSHQVRQIGMKSERDEDEAIKSEADNAAGLKVGPPWMVKEMNLTMEQPGKISQMHVSSHQVRQIDMKSEPDEDEGDDDIDQE
uniref:uncharacterized protein LOC105353024 n=1 Tax=Fragaria vesca subsp. vesca TaxID=101020 RepID=UPI0005CA6056|nr:PREDICTED: uncharacterized protein LOC105353024 [Fragaria vesca subsp. vesca]